MLPFGSSRLVGNVAAAVGLVLVGALAVDRMGAWLGYRPALLCTALGPVAIMAQSLGILLASVGIIIYAASLFKSEAGLGMTVGGLMLGVLPMTLPHYLGAACPA